MGLNVDLNMDDKWNEILTEMRVDENLARGSRVADGENNVVEMFSGEHGQESLEVMELDGGVANVVADLNERLGVIEGPISTNGIGMKATVVDKALDEGNPVSVGEGAVLNGTEYLVGKELGLDRKFEGIHFQPGMLIPKKCREECVTEKEGQYFVSDLVWGKVRSHPWWPGQIVDPSVASDRAMKYFKKDSYLISYFGSQNLAWNEASKIKPFWKYFSQMEKHSNSEAFCHAVSCALDELARRVELAISCPCLLEAVHNETKSTLDVNFGIREGPSKIRGRNDFSTSVSFLPAELVHSIKSLAEAPCSRIDRLKFVTVKAQLLTFNSWKGHHKFSFREELGGFLDHEAHITEHGGTRHSLEVRGGELPGFMGANQVPSKTEKPIRQVGSSWKRKYHSDSDKHPSKRERYMSDLMSLSSLTLLNGEDKTVRKMSKKTISSPKTREVVVFLSSGSEVKRRKSRLSSKSYGKTSLETETYPRVGEHIGSTFEYGDRSYSQDAAKSGGEVATDGLPVLTHGYICHGERMIPTYDPPPKEILSKLCLAAKYPNKGHDLLDSMVSVLCEFRGSICLEKNNARKLKQHAGKHKEKQTSTSKNMSGFVGTEDSYWKDIVIQNFSEDQELFEPEAAIGMRANTKNKQKRDAVIVDCETGSGSGFMDEKSEGSTPIGLILTFTSLESIPSISNLNEIFSQYGPLDESETEILSKSKRAKVFFKRRADAETVFSNTGLFATFGPSLISYRLKYYRKLPKLL